MTLAITGEAAEAIRTILDAHGLPEGSGVRIATKPGDDGAEGPNLALTAETDPVEGDVVIEEDGAVVFLEGAASAYLSGKVLHAEAVGDDRVNFVIQTG